MPISIASGEEAGGADRSILLAWLKQQAESGKRIAGVVTVEVEGRKWMRILSSSEQKLLQLNELSEEEKAKMAEHKKHRATETKTTDSVFQSAEVEKTAAEFGPNVVTVGPFVFDDKVLECGRAELMAGVASGVDILVADEVGPLEVKRGQGLEPAFRQCLSGREKLQLVVIVRPNLWDFFGEHYDCKSDVSRMDFSC